VRALAGTARDLGLAGIAIMPPHFYPVSAADQLAFFLAAAEAADPLPVMLYNFPELTGNRIAPETVSAFAARARLAGFKQSGAEFGYHETLVALGREHRFALFSGADTRLPEVFGLGAAGCIGGLVNMVPELMLEQFRVFRQGAPGELEPTASRMREVGEILGRLTFPLNVPAGLAARGFDPGVPKAILSPASQEAFARMVEVLRDRFAAWGLSTR
jgi:4-hydroxy-tetrahydrodipicolinate synthase